jgi:hypothetical protein
MHQYSETEVGDPSSSSIVYKNITLKKGLRLKKQDYTKNTDRFEVSMDYVKGVHE